MARKLISIFSNMSWQDFNIFELEDKNWASIPVCTLLDRFEGLFCYLKREIDAFFKKRVPFNFKVQVPVGVVSVSNHSFFLTIIFSQEEEEASSHLAWKAVVHNMLRLWNLSF